MDEHHFEQAQALTERLTRAGIEQSLQCHPEPPLVINNQRLCLDCRYPLTVDRLNANPNAARCTECQTDHEKEHRRHG